jgi:hypothetical protein
VYKYDANELKSDLANRAQSFCEYLFPNGRCKSGEYFVGSLYGEQGNSLKIRVGAPKLGLWKDFATGEGGSNLLDLLCKIRGRNFRDTCDEAANWLRDPEHYRVENYSGKMKQSVPEIEQTKLKRHDFKDLQDGSKCDFANLAELLSISLEGVLLAAKDSMLKFFDHRVNGRCWSVVDKQNYVRQDRRLDGKPFILRDGSKVKSRTVGSPSCPVGLPTEKPIVNLVEGSSDFLADYSLIHGEEVENFVAPVAMLGAANYIHKDVLECCRNKYILGFPDYDPPGNSGMAHWESQLRGIAKAFNVFDYETSLRDDGLEVNDLRDFVRINVDQWESDFTIRYSNCAFLNDFEDRPCVK